MTNKTFTLHTNNHDSCGEESNKTVDYCHLNAVVLYIELYATYSSLNIMRCRYIEDGVEIPDCIKETCKIIDERRKAALTVLVNLGIFTNKWDARTSWECV